MLGDVIAIYASNGALQCRYAYSAWGEHEIYDASGNKITGGDNIGIKNPIRYRGYYYDRELYLYYLQSRYYEPILGRFLSPDSPQYLDPTTIQGLNLYTYCLNNPISYADPSGSVAIITAALIGLIVGAIVGTVIGAVVAGVVSYNSGARGWELAGDILFGAFLGSVIGGIAGLLIGAGLGGMSAGATVIGAAIKGGSALALVLGGTASTGAAIAIGSTQMLIGGVIAIGGIAAGLQIGVNVMFSKLPMHEGPPDGTLSNNTSIGNYDSDGNLIERTDFKGRPHFIKELGKNTCRIHIIIGGDLTMVFGKK